MEVAVGEPVHDPEGGLTHLFPTPAAVADVDPASLRMPMGRKRLLTDLGVRRGAAALGLPATPAALTTRSARWRPWRAYAVQHLWAATDHPINRWPTPLEEAS